MQWLVIDTNHWDQRSLLQKKTNLQAQNSHLAFAQE
jgi:hypothetical protein